MNTSKQLMDEIGERISRDKNKKIGFVLLYQTTDKADVEEFHNKCNAKGPTLTILYGKNNTFFGGYTSKNWQSADMQVIKDENAFLFKKNDNLSANCVFFPIKKNKTDKAIVCDKNFGPTFGVGSFKRYDLQTFKKDRNKPESKMKGDYLKLNGSIKIKFSYSVETDHGDDSDLDINSGDMLVTKLEVYQVTDDEFKENWLERLEGNDFEKKYNELIEMVPLSGLEIHQYNILLLGTVGAGKSSFINTSSTVFSKKVEQIAQSRQSETSVTNKIQTYDFKSVNGDVIKLRFYDIRGIESGRVNDTELELLIEGRLPKDYQFPENPEDCVKDEIPNPTLNDKMHLICFIEGNSNFEKYSDELRKRMIAIKKIISSSGLPMVVIATKFDMLCPKIAENTDHLFKSPKAKYAVNAIAQFHGVNLSQVLPVVNYIDEDTPVKAKDQLAFKALHKIYLSIEGYLKHHPEREEEPDDWRARIHKLPSWDDESKKRNILSDNLRPFNDTILRILLVGPVNSGKSSFINSVLSSHVSKVTFEAKCGSAGLKTENHPSTTEKFKLHWVYHVPDDEGPKRKSGVCLGDTPGFQEQDGIKEDHVNFIISGNVPDGYRIINGIQDTQDDFQRDPTPGDQMHCICFVFDCVKIQEGLSQTIKTTIRNLLRIVSEKECPYIVLLTKCDKVSKSLKKRCQRIFEDKNVRECKDSLMAEFNFHQQEIFPIVNYEEQNDVDEQIDRLILAAFFKILELGKMDMERDVGID